MIPCLDFAEWEAKRGTLPCYGTEKVAAFYEYRMGAVCRDPRALLIPLNDHLVHRGDGIFESLNIQERRIIDLDAHLTRMKSSASRIGLVPPCAWEEIRSIILQTAKAADLDIAAIKLLMGRGCGALGVDPAECPQASFYVIVSKRSLPTESFWDKGISAVRSSIPAKQEWLAQIKSTNYLANALMAKEAREKGVDVAISFDEKGHLAEAAIANIAMASKDGEFLLPEFRFALPGTTALRAAELASGFMTVRQCGITEEMLNDAAEIFMLGTTCECVSIVSYNGSAVGDGRPGPVSIKLRNMVHENLLRDAVPFD